MTASEGTVGPGDIYYDPYDFRIDDDPYPVWKRMRDEVTTAAGALSAARPRAVVEPFGLDVNDPDGLARLTGRVAELGTLRAVAYATSC